MTLILIVDDEAAITDLLADILVDLGYQALKAYNGHEALGKLKLHREALSLIISDVMMPLMNGIEFARAVRAEPALRNVPIILTTAAPSAVPSSLANALIEKPFDIDRLIAQIYSFLPRPHHDEEVQ